MKTAQNVIDKLNLIPLPEEGGFYKETFKSQRLVKSEVLGDMSECTCIYYLITGESFSALHVVDMDEIFHFYAGDPVEMFQIDQNGNGKLITLGPDIFNNEVPQLVVPHGIWQGTKIKDPKPNSWALLGCTVAPGFELRNFHLLNKSDLKHKFPTHSALIDKFARDKL
jgi:predicted cupin superfamily sugar epimerase